MWYNLIMLTYFNRAIISTREQVYGIDRLERIKFETEKAYLKRRKEYIERVQRQRKQK